MMKLLLALTAVAAAFADAAFRWPEASGSSLALLLLGPLVFLIVWLTVRAATVLDEPGEADDR
jgi:hypothetical protein